jgi:4-oxalocrotonate tautomerase
VITVRLWTGRTREQKAELARRITDAMVDVAGCERGTVRVLFDDYAKGDWAVGGRLADEPDLVGRRRADEPD